MADDAPFRRPGKVVSPALAQLVEQGAQRARQLPRDAERLSGEDRRVILEQVFGLESSIVTPLGAMVGVIWSVAFIACVKVSAESGNPVPAFSVLLAALPAALWISLLSRRQATRKAQMIAARMRWPARQPFPVHGYDLWCLSHEPLLDVTLSAPIDRQQLTDALAAIAPPVELTWVDERTARLRIPPTLITYGEGATRQHANPAALEFLVERLLKPLHADVPIERIDMGGVRRG